MRIFQCDRCGGAVAFAAQSCPVCGSAIGYLCEERALRVIVPTDDPAVFRLGRSDGADGPALGRCLNSAWGCNWMLPADAGVTWCRSCRLTRGRPDGGRPAAIDAWRQAEASKRRLVHQLDELALPIEAMSDSSTDGLVFDLVDRPGEGDITGHLDGVVTLDPARTDELHRRHSRLRRGEPLRTVIGHLRYEIGHFYWARLVGQTDELRTFRRLFGDERVDDASAIERHDGASAAADPSRPVANIAASPPLEDWSETFAHYLHILDAVETAAAHHLVPADRAGVLVTVEIGRLDLAEILEVWRPINGASDTIAGALGAAAVYPIDHSDTVVEKLAFVHTQIARHTARDRFYAEV